jgi:hypothetical protein
MWCSAPQYLCSIPTFQMCVLPSSLGQWDKIIVLMMEALRVSETSVYLNETKWPYTSHSCHFCQLSDCLSAKERHRSIEILNLLPDCMTEWPCDRFSDWFTDWLTDHHLFNDGLWLFYWLADSLFDCVSDLLTDRLTDWVTHRPHDGGSTHLWNVGQHPLDYTAVHPTRL